MSEGQEENSKRIFCFVLFCFVFFSAFSVRVAGCCRWGGLLGPNPVLLMGEGQGPVKEYVEYKYYERLWKYSDGFIFSLL